MEAPYLDDEALCADSDQVQVDWYLCDTDMTDVSFRLNVGYSAATDKQSHFRTDR